MEAFIKVYIKSEDDLPKYGEGELLCQLKSGKIGYYPIGTIRCDYERVDWYLKPVEIPEISDEDVALFVFSCPGNSGSVIIDKTVEIGFKLGAKWYRAELKKRLK